MQDETDNPALDPTIWVNKYGDMFYRYALSRLNDHQAAEDVVQETFLGAFKSKDAFRRESEEATWMTSILRRKIVDVIRKRESTRRNCPSEEKVEVSHCSEDQCLTVFGASFSQSPASRLTDAEFVQVVENCLLTIPKSQADVFVLRELEQKDPEEICELLGITRKNLWTRLYRARVALGSCINQNNEGAQKRKVNHAQ